ncbi:retropepsin-like aspartic protease family protein [Sphingomonas panni]
MAKLNGVERRMLIDSGATSTAISEATAQAIGVTPRRVPPVLLTTANGTIEAARGRIETVRIGSLETRDLPVVISPAFGEMDVVGMNFLSRLGSWRVARGTLILEADKAR